MSAAPRPGGIAASASSKNVLIFIMEFSIHRPPQETHNVIAPDAASIYGEAVALLAGRAKRRINLGAIGSALGRQFSAEYFAGIQAEIILGLDEEDRRFRFTHGIRHGTLQIEPFFPDHAR